MTAELSRSDYIALWKKHGGSQHGPNIEHVSMPMYDNFFKFCEALANHKAGEWQPIESAPKDGTPVLLINARQEQATARWRTAEGSNNPILHALAEDGAWIVYGSAFPFDKPIAWRDLPSPPRSGEAG